MGGKYQIVPATDAEVAHVAANLRAVDRFEMEAVIGKADPVQAIKEQLLLSEVSGAVLLENQPVAIFGFIRANLLSPALNAWMLTAEGVQHVPVSFMRHVWQAFEHLDTISESVYCGVWEENTPIIDWLRRIGFSQNGAYVVGGVNFQLYERRK